MMSPPKIYNNYYATTATQTATAPHQHSVDFFDLCNGIYFSQGHIYRANFLSLSLLQLRGRCIMTHEMNRQPTSWLCVDNESVNTRGVTPYI